MHIVKQLTKEEVQHWIDRWSNLKSSSGRDEVIKIWSKHLKIKTNGKNI